MSIATLKKQETQEEADIRALIESATRLHFNKDAAAIAGRYRQDAVIFNLAPPLAHHGVDVQEKQAWLDSWEDPVELEARDFEITVSGDLAFGHGYYRLRASKAGGGGVDFWMRETLCLRRDESGWRIVHEHTSVPFYMDGSLRPAFDLKP
jgi:ketosteroid isomerase-like protein